MKLSPLPVRCPPGDVADLVVTDASPAEAAGLDEVLAWLRSLES